MGSLATKYPIRLQDVLKDKAACPWAGRLLFYSPGNTVIHTELTYADLYAEASRRSLLIRRLPNFSVGQPVLLHLQNHRHAIVWFWAVLLAGGLPVQSSRLSDDPEQRRRHLAHLSSLLEAPICITSVDLLSLFSGAGHELKLHTVDSLELEAEKSLFDGLSLTRHSSNLSSIATLMLTSGSTGLPKAVPLTHSQIFAAIAGKCQVRPQTSSHVFLNWVDLDHVASLVEIHLQALWLGADQVHVHATDLITSPRSFLDLMSRHRVTTSFAPGFFLAKLVQTVPAETAQTWDLRPMRFLASGGEAVSVETCVAASELLSRYGAPLNVITPGFGMTETCAGAIFNTDCPARDITEGYTFACLGTCNNGVEMRVVVPSKPEVHDRLGKPVTDVLAQPGKPGNLQLRGPVVFNGYYKDPEATAMAFTEDGWFETGDEAIIDAHGRLHLVGRSKDVMNVNGTKISTHEVQATLDRALGSGVAWVLVFPSRGPGMDTEQVTVAYVPLSTASTDTSSTDLSAIADTHGRIIDVIVRSTGSSPIIFNVADKSCLPHSSLGKISRARMRSLFEAGAFDETIKSYRRAMKSFYGREHCSSQRQLQEDEAHLLADVLAVLPGLDVEGFGIHTPIFDVGCTSMDLIRLKRRIDDRLNIQVPVILLAKNPTASMLATALRSFVHQQLSSPDPLLHTNQLETRTPISTSIEDYDPVVVLRPGGHKTPLWLIHPGVGEVLVFVGLVHHLRTEDRPVYALRAPGFEPGQRRFRSIAEAVTCYQANIRRKQPQGPYAIAGYSYGGMLAFETAKALEAEGQQVRLVAILNLPPHIRTRVSSVSWALCLLHVSYFLGLCSEQHVDRVEADPKLCEHLHSMPRAEAIDFVLGGCGSEEDRVARMAELAQHPASLAIFADVAHGLQSMAAEYEPQGSVAALDVFHAMPLRAVARDRDEWLSQLAPWRDFCRSEVRFHAVGGAHNTMLHPEHVHGFSEMLKMVLKDRNI